MTKKVMTDAAAERAVVGAALLRPDVVGWLDMEPRRFLDPKLQHVWTAMQKLHARGAAIDVVTLGAELGDKVLDNIGGLAYLSELALAVPTADNVEHYAGIVRQWAITREVLLALSYGREQFDINGVLGDDLLDETVAYLSRIERPAGKREVTLAQAVKDELAAIHEDLRILDEGGKVWVGMPTGIECLDAETGGVPLSKLTILGARPGDGKSSTLMQILLNVVCDAGRGAILFSYEDPVDVWARKALGCISGINTKRIRDRVQLTPSDLQRLHAAEEQMEDVWNRLKIITAHGMRMQEVVRIIRGLRRRLDVGIVAIDYIQNVPAPYPERKEKRTYEIQESLTLLEQVVSEEEIAAIVVSQLKRPPQDRSGKRKEDPRPTMNDLKDSGALEQKGKLILALRSTQEMERYNQIGIGILKFNEGKNYVEVVPTFDRERSRVY